MFTVIPCPYRQTMEVSNFHRPSANLRLNRPSSSCNETVSRIKDFSSSRFMCINQSLVFHCSSSLCMKQQSLVLAHRFGRGRGTGILPNHHHCSWGTEIYSAAPPMPRPYLFRSSQVKSEDSERILSGESIILAEQTLEQELQIAIQEENYAQAAKIRDSLRVLQEDGQAAVLAANARFYNSFRNGDLAAMQALWTKGDNACVVHPGVSGIHGYDLVMGSWEFVWADYDFPLEIEIKDVQVHVRGDVGCVTCTELVRTNGSSWGRQFATNVFERIDGQWFISIHHASHIDL